MKILIGTKNPGKIQGAKEAFENYFNNFDIEGIPVPSNVSEQPVNNEIYEGARNRVNNLIKSSKENNIEADYYLGIESGITNLLGKWIIINIAVIKDKNGYESWGTSSGFPVPNKYVDEIIETDLGKVMDNIFQKHDLRSNKGGISFLTKDVIDRIDLTKDAFIMALTQYINEVWNDRN
ncbi:MAG: inosine/xanthosine triphosphatase [Clostridiales bacterium]|nr:inosine/xanthosine triphosphatase [Clostridiales bacterium]